MMVKKTCMNKLTALTITLNRYNHASPVGSSDLLCKEGEGRGAPVIVQAGEMATNA
jgi:hypothetical protein